MTTFRLLKNKYIAEVSCVKLGNLLLQRAEKTCMTFHRLNTLAHKSKQQLKIA